MSAIGDEGQDHAAGRRSAYADVATRAAVQSAASYLALVVVVVAVNVGVARRQAIVRAYLAAVAKVRQDARRAREAGQLADFRRDISEISHAAGGLTDE